jgi:hypothetical protein
VRPSARSEPLIPQIAVQELKGKRLVFVPRSDWVGDRATAEDGASPVNAAAEFRNCLKRRAAKKR